MPNFRIMTQIDTELKEFDTTRIKLATYRGDTSSVRNLQKPKGVYDFNQGEMVSLIDLYHNSIYENGMTDALGQRKMFLNTGKFRTDVAEMQIDLDTKNGRFIPDDYADPWVAIFLQKEFKEWAKDSYRGELLNTNGANLPKYGTIVNKKVGPFSARRLQPVSLQLLKNEQTAEDLMTAAFVIEEHPDMYLWEMQNMDGWNLDGLNLKFNDRLTTYERYGRVPIAWLMWVNSGGKDKPDTKSSTWKESVDSMVIAAHTKDKTAAGERGTHIFFAEELGKGERPYLECHWSKQHGRWLGVGVMEDEIENQVGTNIAVNLMRRALHWSTKRLAQSNTTDVVSKNLLRDVPDGTVIEVGANGNITPIDLSNRSAGEFQQFLGVFEKNADQKAFTYDVATGASPPSGTPATLGVLLSKATQSHFGKKKQIFGLYMKRIINQFMVPDFLQDMSNGDKILTFFSDEAGIEILREAALSFVRNEIARISILSGQPVDAAMIISGTNPFEVMNQFVFKREKTAYKDVKHTFDFTFTDEEIGLDEKLQVLQMLYQSLSMRNDPRAEKALARIAALGGENISTLGSPQPPAPPPPPPAPAAVPSPNAQRSGAVA